MMDHQLRYQLRASRCRRHGFTLVEVISVIVILSVLLAITFSVASPVKQAAREAHAKSNLHQLHLAHLLYQADQAGHSEVGTASEMGLPEVFWFGLAEHERGILGPKELWVSPCGDLPVVPNAADVGRSLQTWISNNDTWRAHSEKSGTNAVMLMDDNCNPANINIDNLMVRSKSYVLRFHGGVNVHYQFGRAIDLRDHEND